MWDMQKNSEAVRTGLGLLAAAVATLAVSAAAASEPSTQPGSEKAPAKSGGSLRRLMGQVANFAEGVLFSFALGVAGKLSLPSCRLNRSNLAPSAIAKGFHKRQSILLVLVLKMKFHGKVQKKHLHNAIASSTFHEVGCCPLSDPSDGLGGYGMD